jgi:hypothetical protein
MKRCCIAALVAALWMTAGCRLFEPEPRPVYCYPMSSYCCPNYSYQACAPATAAPCVPASAASTYVRPSAAPAQISPAPSNQGYPQSSYPGSGR